MFNLEYPVILIIIAIFVQMIITSLIIVFIYTKLKNLQNKKTDSSNNIHDKLEALEAKLSDLSLDISEISRKQTEINSISPATISYPSSSSYPSLFDNPLNPSNSLSDSPNLEENINSWDKNLKNTEISSITNDLADSAYSGDLANNHKIQSSLSQSEPSPSSPSPSSSPSSLSTTPLQPSSFDKADDNKPANMSMDIDKSEGKSDLDHDNDFSSSTSSSHNLHPQERNSNPELDSIEEEILTALKRLGRTEADTDLTKEADDSGSNSSPENSKGKTSNGKK